jgi:hypothetical protein
MQNARMVVFLVSLMAGRIWKEVVIACFKVLSQHLPGSTEENHEKPVRIVSLWVSNLRSLRSTNMKPLHCDIQ